jgi:hypothetical protein
MMSFWGANLVKAFALLWLQANVVVAFQYNRFNSGEEWESLDNFRRRRGIDFDYNTTALHPEFCRHMNQSACEGLDSRARRLQSSTRPIGEQKLLVILLKVTNNFPTIPRDDFDLFFNDRGIDSDITPTGSVHTYLRDNSYNQLFLDAYVHDWVDAQGTEASCAGPNGQQGFWEGYHRCWIPALNQLGK